MFLNETQHLQAPLLAACLYNAQDYEDCYATLERWRRSRGMSDEQAADLYCRIEEGMSHVLKFPCPVSFEDITTEVSKHLWASDKEFPHG